MKQHESPSTEVFNEMKTAATEIWNTYNNDFGYVDEKLERVNYITNYADNAMVFYRMFDASNQNKMLAMLGDDAKEYIKINQRRW